MKLRELVKMFSKIQNADECDVRFLGKDVERVFLSQRDGRYWINLEPATVVGRTISHPKEIRKIVGCENRIQTREGHD